MHIIGVKPATIAWKNVVNNRRRIVFYKSKFTGLSAISPDKILVDVELVSPKLPVFINVLINSNLTDVLSTYRIFKAYLN